MLSIIIPAYNEQENIERIISVLSDILKDIPHEILFVDDGSSDDTWNIIVKNSSDIVKGFKFSRNFGKEGAIFAGLKNAKGDCAAVIDCDLQHPPEILLEMYNLWQQGYEVVEAVKKSRGKEGLFYKFFARSFYKMMKSSSNINLDRASDFKLLDRKAVNALNELPERLTFFRALSGWVGFKSAYVEFEVAPRAAGQTKWSFKKLSVFAINSITSFTNLPTQIITAVGLIFLLFSVILGIQTLINFFLGKAQAGFSTVILLLLIIGSILMLGIGIIGYYISKIYEEIKFRPRYIISKSTEQTEDKIK